MERLLHWAVENSDAQGFEESREKMQQLDPEVIEMILGKDDPTRMKECINVIRNEGEDEEKRLQAFDELEMLVEGIDNASNMDKMGLWPVIFACLQPGESLQVTKFALWIIGTCAQNNPETQKCLQEKHGVFSALLELWKRVPAVQSKIMYCLSSLLSNNPSGLELFINLDGFNILNSHDLEDESVAKKLKFLITILSNEISPEALRCLIKDCPSLIELERLPSDD